MALLRFLLPALLLSCASAAQAQRVSSVSLDTTWHGLPQISVTLNDALEGRFVVDTAASKTMLSDQIIDRLGLSGLGQPAHLSGSTGRAAIRLLNLASLRLGTREYRRLDAFSLPRTSGTAHLDGLLGADILREHVVEFDMTNRRLRLLGQHADFIQSGGEWVVIPFHERADGLLIVPVAIGGLRMPALFDTGATQNIMNHAAAQALGIRLFPDSASREMIGGASGHSQAIHQIDISRFSLGSLAFGWSRVGVADLAVFDTLEMSGRPAMLLSASALADRRFIVDYPRDRLLIEAGD